MKNHICEVRINMSEIVILAVCFQLKQLKKQPKKIKAWTGSLNFFLGCFFNCLSWKHTARITISVIFRRVFIWVIFPLLWFCIATLCDWLKHLVPLYQPIRSKTKTNRDLCDMYLLRTVIGSLSFLCLLWLARGIGWHSS